MRHDDDNSGRAADGARGSGPARVQSLDGRQAAPGPGPRHALPAEGVFRRARSQALPADGDPRSVRRLPVRLRRGGRRRAARLRRHLRVPFTRAGDAAFQSGQQAHARRVARGLAAGIRAARAAGRAAAKGSFACAARQAAPFPDPPMRGRCATSWQGVRRLPGRRKENATSSNGRR